MKKFCRISDVSNVDTTPCKFYCDYCRMHFDDRECPPCEIPPPQAPKISMFGATATVGHEPIVVVTNPVAEVTPPNNDNIPITILKKSQPPRRKSKQRLLNAIH